MNNTDIGVWSCARTSSKRCPEKMVRSFHDTTLTDIFLAKLSKLKNNVFFAGFESIFKEKCQKYDVTFVQRSYESANVDEPAAKIYEFLLSQPYDYFLQVNACAPFLKVDTIVNFLKECTHDRRPSFAVVKKKNYLVHPNGEPINWSRGITTINTKKVDYVYEFAHLFYFFKKTYFAEHGWYWDWNDLRYIEIPEGLEVFDIDTEEQFLMAESIWKDRNYPKM
ncbi:MAG: hypothetical protein M0R66_00135 [Candidatus Omnitrophica bacterium]|nr:hypothetical protein [Candidatus Omnitrophota bacterium]